MFVIFIVLKIEQRSTVETKFAQHNIIVMFMLKHPDHLGLNYNSLSWPNCNESSYCNAVLAEVLCHVIYDS